MIAGRTRNAVFFAPDEGGGAGGAGAGGGAGGAGAGGAGGAGGGGAGGAGGAGAGAGGAGGAGGGGFAASLPETLRGHAAFKDVKDLGDLATRYAASATPKPFAETLPEDIREEAMFKDIKDVESLARTFHGQAKLLGVPKDQLIRVPGADADDKALAEVYTKLGRPESADKYVLTPLEGQQFSEADKSFHAAILPAIHGAGLNQKQLDTIVGAWNAYAVKATGAQQAALKAGTDAEFGKLKTEWGADYDSRITRAGDALEHLAGAAKVDLGALKGELDRSGLASRPALTKLLDHLGAQFQEDGVLKGREAGGAPTTSAIEAKQQIAALASDTAFQAAWKDKNHPGHAAALERRAKLYELAYPAGA